MGAVAATITRSQVHVNQAMALKRARDEGVLSDYFAIMSPPYLANGRNECVREFFRLYPDEDQLIFVDSDNVPSVEHFRAVTKTCTPEEPVVAGWYRGIFSDGTTEPIVFHFDTDTEQFYQIHEHQLFDEAHGDDPVVAVGAAGTGFMCIHRALLEEMREKWSHPLEWFTEPVMGGQMIGEDFGFCARVRHMGYPVLVHRDVNVAHYKEVPL